LRELIVKKFVRFQEWRAPSCKIAMITDRELLRRYVEENAQEAFTEIVHRHVNLVYGAALRQLCGNAALAGDVTQAVFSTLAAKQNALLKIRHLSAWLYTTTRFTVSHTVRSERRRQERERKAQFMHALSNESESPGEFPVVPPKLLDDVLQDLGEREREAILLRFFEGQSFSAIGLALEMSEDAARMQVTRSLEKTRTMFARKGITSSVAAVGALLSSQAIAAPANLAATVSASALAGAVALASATGAKLGVLAFMTTSKTTAWLAGTAALLALGYSGYLHYEAAQRRDEFSRLVQERGILKDQLRHSEQRATRFQQNAAFAEQRLSDLSKKPDALPAANPKPAQMLKAPPDPVVEKRARDAQRMMQMKPLLEAGMPIKGAVVVMRNDKAISHPVSFVMGEETRIESDDGIYTLKPSVRSDGSIKYDISLTKKPTGNDEEAITWHPSVIQTPWGGFTIAVRGAGGKVLAFDPDAEESE
jgi:RNA polymerase sigma factor (sigma-70 family)